MKHVYTLFITILLFIASTQLVVAQGQTTIDIQPKCTLANQGVELTIYRVTGNDFNGSTSITINGQVFKDFIVLSKDQIRVAVQANLISTAGNVQVVANTASGVSQASILSVVGPLRVSSTPNCGHSTLAATGAPGTGRYQWYNPSGQAIVGANSASYAATQEGQYSVSIVTAAGCETTRVPVAATFMQKAFASTEFVKQNLEVGKPGTIKLNSELIDKGHAISITWQAVKNGETTTLGVTDAPAVSPATFEIASAPSSDTYFRAIITPIPSVCYDASSLDVTSQGIVALPVELVSFKALSTKDGVQLNWKTASERDNKGFEVEVSADGKNFRKIAFVESKVGTTSLTQTYSFLDTRATAGTNYYRLKQVDFDGASEYSKTVAVNLTLVSSAAVYPTLVTSDVTVSLASSDEQVTIAVADMAGKQLLTVQNPAERQVILPVQQLQQGIYFVTVISGTQKEVFRFVKR